jgi:hypothetical protein
VDRVAVVVAHLAVALQLLVRQIQVAAAAVELLTGHKTLLTAALALW